MREALDSVRKSCEEDIKEIDALIKELQDEFCDPDAQAVIGVQDSEKAYMDDLIDTYDNNELTDYEHDRQNRRFTEKGRCQEWLRSSDEEYKNKIRDLVKSKELKKETIKEANELERSYRASGAIRQ